ncbi:MAG: nickel-dependent lactate racemase [Chloroflexi bacterium]|nr:nickel-dependent lactate racemase [Chloroflexota bacterium]
MRIKLAYGRSGLWVDVPQDTRVVEPAHLPTLPDPYHAIASALRQPIDSPPLRQLFSPRHKVAVVFSDLTRPIPNHQVLPPLLAEIEAAGIPRSHILLINACGMHRPNTPQELVAMLGREMAEGYPILNHDADAQMRYLGESSFGSPLWINPAYLEADVRILTGLIEPHIFAGFSGGGKGVLPGIAGSSTIMSNHSAPMLNHPQATWGLTMENPIFAEAREAALMTRPTFLLNVTVNGDQEITGVFAGELAAAHDAGIAFARRSAMQPLPQPLDIAVTTNSGYPLDLNLYQGIKGMSAAAQVTKDGGAIIMACQCSEGLGLERYVQLLRMGSSPQELLDMINRPGFAMFDQWAVQLQSQILLQKRVFLHSSLPDEETRLAGLLPCPSIEDTLRALVKEYRQRHGASPTVAVFPQGPMTIPYVAASGG